MFKEYLISPVQSSIQDWCNVVIRFKWLKPGSENDRVDAEEAAGSVYSSALELDLDTNSECCVSSTTYIILCFKYSFCFLSRLYLPVRPFVCFTLYTFLPQCSIASLLLCFVLSSSSSFENKKLKFLQGKTRGGEQNKKCSAQELNLASYTMVCDFEKNTLNARDRACAFEGLRGPSKKGIRRRRRKGKGVN